MLKQYLKAFVQKINEEEGVLDVAIASDDSIDRDGERIAVDGWDLGNFKKNPVLLWAHDYREAPIGKVLSIKKEGDQLVFKPKFAIDISAKAAQVFELYKQGYLNAFSVGFIAKERDGDKFTKVELLEISAVPVPSNPHALVMARSVKGIDSNILKEIEDYQHKSVVPYKDLGIDENEDANWDGKKEMSDCGDDMEKLKEICAWFDKEAPDSKGSYKLPHHRASDKKAVWAGVSAAMAALLGARGGVELPEADRKGVYDHLAKHYKQFDKEAPDFKLVEAQVLKDLNLDFDKQIVINIVDIKESEFQNLQKELENIQKDIKNIIAGANGNGSGHKGPAERSVVSEVALDVSKTKRLLQVVSNSVSTALHAFKQLDDLNKDK